MHLLLLASALSCLAVALGEQEPTNSTLDAFLRRSFEADGNIHVGDDSDFGRAMNLPRTRDIQAMMDYFNSTFEEITRTCAYYRLSSLSSHAQLTNEHGRTRQALFR